MQSACSKSQDGFTLLEVVIALLLLTIGILAAAHMQMISRYGIGKAHMGILNSVSAGVQLERLLAMAYNDPQLSDLNAGYYPEDVDHGPFRIAATQSSIEWEVHDDFPVVNTKRITVTIRFRDQRGMPRTFSYDYIKSRNYT